MSFLSLRGIGLRYGAVAALDAIDLDVARGSRLAVVGASGSGKSTLLRVLAGFEAPETGQVHLDGELIVDGPRIVPAHRRAIGLVAQEGALFPHLTVAENIGFGVARQEPGRDAWIEELVALVGLDAAMLRRKPDALSGGQQQRVALARALACRPRLMLLDEPFSALDTALRAGTRQAVATLLARAGVTTVLVTHDQEEALSFADQVAVLQDGRLLRAGAPRELYLHPGSEAVAHLLGAAIVLPATMIGDGADCSADCVLGRIPVDRAGSGAARIMLRQEQIVLSDTGLDSGPGIMAEIVQTQFGGGVCTVTLMLPGATGLTLRAPQNAVPASGSTVRLNVIGRAHLL